jgi:hypothetical protein
VTVHLPKDAAPAPNTSTGLIGLSVVDDLGDGLQCVWVTEHPSQFIAEAREPGGTVDENGRLGSLIFAGRKQRGRYAVRAESGALKALVVLPWHGSSFTATTPEGATLCKGRLSRYGFSGTWIVTGADGRPLLTTRWRWTGTTARVTLAGDRDLVLRTRLWKPGFTLTGPDGSELARAEPGSVRLRLARRDYLLRQTVPALTLAEQVALFEIWRLNQDSA